MIKANELRVGNWVDGGKAGLIRIEKICPGSVDAIGQDYDIVYFAKLDHQQQSILKFEDINPILLTPKILLLLGASKSEDNFYGAIDQYVLSIPVKGSNENEILFNFPADKINKPFGRYTVNDYHGSNNFESLHILQNLYYILTVGNEIEIPALNQELFTFSHPLILGRTSK